ncbi:hypothetical protein Tco_0937376 [Tanacetum coccineum]|uniref:Uncharacterized protein n=1 Tax=Tanacetum coccineum TaxID=301880 RepID=A0ABQ5DE15_9ASTR
MSGRRSRRGTCGWIESFSGRADACWVFLSINIVNFFSHALIETKSLPSSSLLPDPDLPFETIDFLIEEQGRSEVTLESYQLTWYGVNGVWGMGMGYGVWGMVWGLGNGVWGLGFGVWGMGYGVWGMGYGVWGMGYGVWGMGYGVWGMGYGVWGMGYGV